MGVLAIIVGTCVYAFTYEKPLKAASIVAEKHYVINRMDTGLFSAPNSNGMYTNSIMYLNDVNDTTYCYFSPNFKTFHIVFDRSPDLRFDFIVTSLKRGKGRLDATIKHIYSYADNKVDIFYFKITTTETEILLTRTAIYRVLIASERYTESPEIEVFRGSATVMSFSRTREVI